MSVKSKLNVFNRCFMVFGLGSIHYNGNDWTAMIFCVCRSFTIYVNLRLFAGRHRWVKMFDSTMFDVLSIVLIFGFELSCFADVVSTAWRVLFDVRLSAVLTRLENVHETLIRLNAVGPMTVKYERLAAIGVCIHFTAYICRQIRFVVLHLNTNNVPVVIGFFSKDVLQCVALYEYLLLTLYAKWLVNAINERIGRETTSSVSALKQLYAVVLQCLHDSNTTVFGVPALTSFIGGHVADIIECAYYNVLFFDKFVNPIYSRGRLVEFVYLSTRLANVILLFGLCRGTEKEVNRTVSVLYERSVVETNPAVHRQIKYFILQKLHKRFHFELCGFYKIDYGQLLTLLSKTFAFLMIQTQFKLNRIDKK